MGVMPGAQSMVDGLPSRRWVPQIVPDIVPAISLAAAV